MTFCTNCGKDHQEGTSFCNFCGQKIPRIETPEENPVENTEVEVIDPPVQKFQDIGDSLDDSNSTIVEEDLDEGIESLEGTLEEARVEEKRRIRKPGEEWQIGDVIEDTYEILGSASGNMGTVYFVHHRNWNTKLAVKSPHPWIFKNERGRQRYIREAETWIDLGLHPYTVSAYYVRTLDDIPRIFVEFVDGGTLTDWIKDGRTRTIENFLDLAIQICDGMAYTHEKGMVHRDLKPDNVMMTKDGTAKITDFGLVRVGEESGVTESATEIAAENVLSTMAGSKLGTPVYMAPEQWRSPETVGEAADIYSYGVILFEMLTGEPPFKPEGTIREKRIASLEYQHCSVPAPDIGEILPDLPDGIKRVVNTCLEKDPNKRPQGMRNISDALRGIYKSLLLKEYPRQVADDVELQVGALNNRAVSYFDLGRTDEAKKLLEEALSMDSLHPETVYNHGLMQWRAAKATDEDVIKRLEGVAQNKPDDSRIKQLISMVHLERGDSESAIDVLTEAESLSNQDEEIKSLLAKAQASVEKSGRCIGVIDGHPREITSVDMSADGKYAITGCQDNIVRLWDLDSGNCLQELHGHTAHVTSVAMTPDARLGLSASWDETIRIWDLSNGDCIYTFEHEVDDASGFALSPNGKYAAAGGFSINTSITRLWDIDNKKYIRKLTVLKQPITSTAFSSDSRFISACSKGGEIGIWEIASSKLIRRFDGHKTDVTTVAFNSKRNILVTGSEDNTVKIWDPSTAECLHILKGHGGSIRSVTASGDGLALLSGGNDRTVRHWDIASGRCLRTFQGHTMGVTGVALSFDGSKGISVSMDTNLRQWLIADGKPQSWAVCKPSTSLESAELARQAGDLKAKAKRAFEQGQAPKAYKIAAEALAIPEYSKDSDLLKLQRQAGLNGRISTFRFGWEAAILDKHKGGISSIGLSRDGKKLLSGSEDKKIFYWDLQSSDLIKALSSQKGDASEYESAQVAFSSNGEHCYHTEQSTSLFNRLFIQNPEVKTNNTAYFGHTGLINSFDISPDGNLALTASDDNTIRLWHVGEQSKWKEQTNILVSTFRDISLNTFNLHMASVTAVTFSPNGLLGLSGGSDKTLRLFDLRNGECLRTLYGHDRTVNDVAFSPDGLCLASCSDDGTIRLWNADSGVNFLTLTGHVGAVNSIYFSPDGQYLLSGGEDMTVRLWSDQCIAQLTGHRGEITCVAFTPDSRFAVSGSKDGTIRKWELVWDYEFFDGEEWDEGAKPYLQQFLVHHTPYSNDRISRTGDPVWYDADISDLMDTLRHFGYGWLEKERVVSELEVLGSSPDRIYLEPLSSGLLAKERPYEFDAIGTDHINTDGLIKGLNETESRQELHKLLKTAEGEIMQKVIKPFMWIAPLLFIVLPIVLWILLGFIKALIISVIVIFIGFPTFLLIGNKVFGKRLLENKYRQKILLLAEQGNVSDEELRSIINNNSAMLNLIW